MNDKPILLDYFEKKSNEIFSKFETTKLQENSTDIGTNREIFIKNFLEIVMPPKLKNIYNGEIIDNKGNKTGQLDLIVVRDDAPCLDFGGINTYLVEGVFAVIEVKSELNKKILEDAKKQLEKVSLLSIDTPNVQISGSLIGPNLHRPLRILFSYSSDTSIEAKFNNINEMRAFKIFDLICILDKGVIIPAGRLLSLAANSPNPSIMRIKDINFYIEGPACALGFLYYYLIEYGTSFNANNINIGNYFHPIGKWGEYTIPNQTI